MLMHDGKSSLCLLSPPVLQSSIQCPLSPAEGSSVGCFRKEHRHLQLLKIDPNRHRHLDFRSHLFHVSTVTSFGSLQNQE